MLNLEPKTDKIKKSLNTYKFLMKYGWVHMKLNIENYSPKRKFAKNEDDISYVLSTFKMKHKIQELYKDVVSLNDFI